MMKIININNPHMYKVVAASIPAKYRYHVRVKTNNSFHDYVENWTIIRAGKNSKTSKTVADIIAMSERYEINQVEYWKMSRSYMC